MLRVGEQNGMNVIDVVCNLHLDFVVVILEVRKSDRQVRIVSNLDVHRTKGNLFQNSQVNKDSTLIIPAFASAVVVSDFMKVGGGLEALDFIFNLSVYVHLLPVYSAD